MKRFAAAVAIGLGVLLAFALWRGPSAEVEQQAGPPAKDRPTCDPPLPSGERAGVRKNKDGENLPLPSRERVGVMGGERVKLASAPSPAPKDRDDAPDEEPPLIDPLSANAACYVCHMTFIGEEFSQVHLKEKITCIECHGVSGPHANDENIGATLPDITFERGEVDASCAECHDEHDVSPRKIITRWLERGLPDSSPICTDCHGTHKIEQPEEEEEQEAGPGTAGADPALAAEQ